MSIISLKSATQMLVFMKISGSKVGDLLLIEDRCVSLKRQDHLKNCICLCI
jgi:hypothetical protein